MLGGTALQAPLYAAISGTGASVEFLGVGPDDAGAAAARRAASRVVFEGFSRPEVEAGFRETMRVLVDVARRGSFALRDDRHCRWCPYAGACRRKHPPTAERERLALDSRDYRDLSRKRKKKCPTLAMIRAGGAAPEEAS